MRTGSCFGKIPKRVVAMLLVPMITLSIVPSMNVWGVSEEVILAASSDSSDFYHVEGTDIIDPDGNVAVLKGISFGNTNYGNPSTIEEGPWNDHDEESYKELAAMGIDHVRFEINYGLFEDDDDPYNYKESGFEWLDQNIEWAKEYGISLIIEMKHPQGGYQMSSSSYDLTSVDSGGKALWMGDDYQENQARLIALWTAIAERYADEPTIIGYGLVNEPTVPEKDTVKETVAQWQNLAQRIADGIRSVDQNHILFVERIVSIFNEEDYNATNWDLLSISDSQVLIDDDNTVYEFHFYDPAEFTSQGASWWSGMEDLDTSYPSVIYDIDYNTWKGETSVTTGTTENGWTYFESEEFALTDDYMYGKILAKASAIGSSNVVYYDDIVVTRYDSNGNAEVLLTYDFSENTIDSTIYWAENSVGSASWSESEGHNGSGSLAINGATALATYGLDWICLESGYTYTISGWVKNTNGVGSAYPEVSYYPGTATKLTLEAMETSLKEYLAFSEENNVPVFVGEWGIMDTCYGKGEDQYVSDLTSLFEKYGLSSNYHAYHDPNFGLYLEEEWQERGDRNETLYQLLTTYYCTPVDDSGDDGSTENTDTEAADTESTENTDTEAADTESTENTDTEAADTESTENTDTEAADTESTENTDTEAADTESTENTDTEATDTEEPTEVPKSVPVITAKAASTSIVYGGTTTITAGTTGDGTLSYSSGNTAVATVSSDGKVTAKGVGTAVITISSAETDSYEAASTTVTISVTKASQTLSTSSSSVYLAVGKTSTPTVSGAKTSLTYSSSDTSVATVSSSGVITAKGVGTAVITVIAAVGTNYNQAAKTISVTVKPASTTISSVTNTTSGVKITWKKVTGATGYYVYRSTSKNGTYTKIATIKNGSTVTYTNKSSGTNKAASGKTYYYKVSAYASTGTADKSAAKSVKYLTAGKIKSLTNTTKGITVKWSKVSGASGYYVYRKTGSGSYKKVTTIKSASTVSYTDTAVKSKNGTTYTYKVVPYSGSNTGSFTAKKTVRMTAVSLSSVKNSSSKKMTVKWKKNSKATGYQIQYSTSKSFASGIKTVTVSKAATTSKVIGSLKKGKTYYVRIRAYKTVSGTKYCSAWSSKKSVKISK